MYSQISTNRRNSALLIALFVGLLAAAGYFYDYLFLPEARNAGLAFALVVSLGMTIGSWFVGDKIVLLTSGAHEIKTRDENPYVWNLVENLSITAGLPMPRVHLINDPSPNAFATGRDPKHASIAMTTGIVDTLENEELEGVIAHELSHVKNLDIRWMMLVAVMVGALTLIGDIVFRNAFYRRRGRDENGGGLMMVLGLAFLILAPIVGQLIKFAISRQREFLADASGALLTRYPEGLARALEKIRDAHIPLTRSSAATAHLWVASPDGSSGIGTKIANLFSTHPPIQDRIRRLKEMGK